LEELTLVLNAQCHGYPCGKPKKGSCMLFVKSDEDNHLY
jgi:hypothetical protein